MVAEADGYAPNRSQVIQDALEMCGGDVYGETDSAIIASASRSLNALIKALNTNKTDVNVIERTPFNTVAGDEDYETDAIGVDYLFVTVAGGDSPCVPITVDQYNAKSNKQASGRPSEFYHDKEAGMLYLYPSPDAAYTVTYGKIRRYTISDELDAVLDFPASAIEMLTFGLAHRVSIKRGLDAGKQDRLEAQFDKAEKRYTVANTAYTKGQRQASGMVV
jgi:hypothetical protein